MITSVLVAGLALALACASDDGGSGSANNASSDAGASGDAAAAPSGDCKTTPDDQDLNTQAQDLYAGRPDTQAADHEAELGNCVRVAGYTAFVNSAEMRSAEFSPDQLVVNVTTRNRDEAAQPFNYFDWRLQTAEGQVIDPTIPFTTDDELGSGDLVSGGEATGDVAFDVGPGTYFVIYKPDPFNDARGIWQITV